MMYRLLNIVLSVFVLGGVFSSQASFAQDEERLTVVELFTSQGCSSCPPADAALKSMRNRPNILTLSWAVDYWDRLGWEDTYASPSHTKRQAAYNKRFGRGGVYTPQMVIDGAFQAIGSKNSAIRDAIDQSRATSRIEVKPTLTPAGETIQLDLPATEGLPKELSVRVVWYLSDAEVQINRGENEGRVLHYTNVVRASEMVMDWDGSAQSISLKVADGVSAGADHVAILLQEGYRHGKIIGAVSMPLNGEEETSTASDA
ncbi:thioredoxin family protein [Kordiimonas sp. SCSIO 12610]|uniref:DUF1223 domain-containing protein n=1 Tax=Kordiimonas sp. SCSIO 12610 TaxID=2829597 RepID=UPI00210F1220|nr:DUF1223 domain-containing protein [Kordiimonas sp. SCSIO 12610]UTW55408.1 DUF1223 domain-containing protein [Kordiimonas sp. SCSIO 12610]